jgi:hypothetical protein
LMNALEEAARDKAVITANHFAEGGGGKHACSRCFDLFLAVRKMRERKTGRASRL